MQCVKVVASIIPKQAKLDVNQSLTIQSESVQCLADWLEGLTIEGSASSEDADTSADRPILPPTLCVEQT